MPRNLVSIPLQRLVVVLGLTLAATQAQADYVSTSFTLPGSLATSVWDINDSGALVGQAYDATSGFGFVYNGGVTTRLNGPTGANSGSAIGISNNGLVVGEWFQGDGVTVPQVASPFVYSMATNSYTVTSLALPGTDVWMRGISPDGRYVTGYYTPTGGGSNGFVWDLSTNHQVADISASASLLIAQGINASGQVVGDYRRTDGTRGAFLYDLNTGTRTDFSFSGVTRLAPRAINDAGQISGWLQISGGVERAWIGNASGYQLLSFGDPAKGTIAEGINNLGQVVGFKNDPTGDYTQNPGFVASPVVLPTLPAPGTPPTVYTFSAQLVADVPVFIDPLVAVGYDYQVGAGDPLFKTVSLPAGVGDNLFDIEVNGQHFTVHGNQIFDFTAHGFASGVGAFSVHGIEASAMVDPNSPQAFVTRLTFAGSGQFTGTQTALTVDYTPPVPEPATYALWLMGLLGLGLAQRRTPTQR
jgi:probable HAF family extracellular repeat protein